VRTVVQLACEALGRGDAIFQTAAEGPHESAWLALDSSKAADVLGVRPRFDLAASITRTVAWYCRQSRGEPAAALCNADIDAFEAPA
jgi:CDP-glucose 4,6-dehydratase